MQLCSCQLYPSQDPRPPRHICLPQAKEEGQGSWEHTEHKLTGYIMKADDLVHEGSGQDDLIKDGDTAPHHASVPPLWVHSQVSLMAMPGTNIG